MASVKMRPGGVPENMPQQAQHILLAYQEALKLLFQGQQKVPFSVEDAANYFSHAKETLGMHNFQKLLSFMGDGKITIKTRLLKLCQVLHGHPELLQGFGMFLPPDVNLQFQTGSLSLDDIPKEEVPFTTETLDSDELAEIEKEVAYITSMDVDSSPSNASSDKSADPEVNEEPDSLSFLDKVKQRFENEPEVFSSFITLLSTVKSNQNAKAVSRDLFETQVFVEMCELFDGHDDLIEEFKAFVPHANYGQNEQDTNKASDQLGKVNSKEDSSTEAVEEIKITPVNDPSYAGVYIYGSYEEHAFFDEVRTALGHQEVYDNFLRCLMMYNEDLITSSELIDLTTSFLGRYPDLHRKLKEILGYNDAPSNYEAIPMKIVKIEKEREKLETGLDVDYSNGARNGASYRALSKDFKQPVCTGRTPLCKEVLNDTWVSFPSWSEDSTFVTSCKTQYEEIIYRCEDERFELDMAINANTCTMLILQDIQKKMSKMNLEERGGLHLDDTLNTGGSTVLHQKALHRLYGDKTNELVEGLKRNPWVAVPIILKRLRAKDEEWRERQKRYNEQWRQQIDHYFLKSLDHRGINFKQTDPKTFRPKSLEKEMEMVYAEKKANDGFNTSHFVLEFKRMEVFQDAINLMLQYLKKISGVYRDDRRKIEQVIRSFIPDIFSAPRCTLAGNVLEVEEESREAAEEPMEIQLDEDERSGQTSPAASTRDDILSDLDESLSNSEDNSEETDKSFGEEIDVFEKIDPLPSTNMPYTMFFASKTWYIFFRQFHILCDRLSSLLIESTRIGDNPSSQIFREDDIDSEEPNPLPTYTQLIQKLSRLLSGDMDYGQFEEESRSLFGIHAFVSYTMDKLVFSIVRQLHQVVTDDISKQCTALFIQHVKALSNYGFASPMEASNMEHRYLRTVQKVIEDQKCFKVVWHKKLHTITIEYMEKETNGDYLDPIETEKWANYLEDYVVDQDYDEDIVEECVEHVPVLLPRNLRKMQAFWKRKVEEVEKSWQTQESAKSQRRSLVTLRKRRALALLSHAIPKMLRRSNSQKDVSEPITSKLKSMEVNDQQPAEEINEPSLEEQETIVEQEKHEYDKETIKIEEDSSEKLELIVVGISEDQSEVQEESVEIEMEEVPYESPAREQDAKSRNLSAETKVDSSPELFQEEAEAMAEDDDDDSSEEENDEEMKSDEVKSGIPENTNIMEEAENVGAKMDLSSIINDAVETASQVIETVFQEETSNQNSINESQKSEDESQKSEDELQKSEDESEKSEDESEKSEDESEKSEDEAQKSDDELQKSGDESQKSEDESEKSEDDESQKSEDIMEESQDEPLKKEGKTEDSKSELLEKEESLKEGIEQKLSVGVLDSGSKEETKTSDQECVDGQEEKSDAGSSKSGGSWKTRTRQKMVKESKVDDSETSDQDISKNEEKTKEESLKNQESKKQHIKRNVEDIVGDNSEEDISTNKQECVDKQEMISSAEQSPKSRYRWKKRPLRKRARMAEPLETKEELSDQDKDEDKTTTEEDSPTKSGLLQRYNRRKPYDYSVRTRRNRSNQTYMRKRMRKGIVKTLQSKNRRRNKKPKVANILDDPNFDYLHFSELSEEDKIRYLVYLYLCYKDDVEVVLKPQNQKINFVRGRDLYLHREKSLQKAKEAHQTISEIKTSNFNAWHRVWLDRYVPPSMVKVCNDWMLKSDPESYKLVRLHISDCKKPPYIPYYKYKLRYYKVDSQ